MKIDWKVNYISESFVRTWSPMGPAIIFWIIAFTNYHVGFVYYDFIKLSSYVYLSAFFSAALLAYPLGKRCASSRAHRARVCSVKVIGNNVLYAVALTTFAGLFLLTVDRMFISGISISRVIEDTASIRDVTELSGLTTLASPLAGCQLVLFVIYFHRVYVRQNIPTIIHLIVVSTIGMRLFLSVVSTNRLAFIFVLAWVSYLLVYILGTRVRSMLSITKRVRWKLAIICMFSLTAIYVLLISRYRTDESYLLHSTKGLEDRYGLRMVMDPQMANSILTLSTYTTQQFIYIDRGLEIVSPLAFRPQSMFTFFLRQLARVGITGPYYSNALHQQNRRYQMNFAATGWPSLPGFGMFLFGSWGFPVFIFAVCFSFGYSSLYFLRTGSIVALSWNFLFFNYACVTHMGVPSDQYYSVLLLFCIFCPLFTSPARIQLRRQLGR